MTSHEFIVYGLVDPTTSRIRYVGKSANGMRRPSLHFCPSNLRGESHKERWVRSVLARGAKPRVVVLERCASADDVDEAEARQIAVLRSAGARLTNTTPGGKGKPLGGSTSEETRLKISRALTGRKYGPRLSISGTNSPSHKLDEQDVLFIREARMRGATQQMLADFFDIKQPSVFAICSGKNWRHVGGPIGKFIHNVRHPRSAL